MNEIEIGNDEVVAALQVIIDKFGNAIEPHAVVLVKQVTTGFQRYCATTAEDDDTALAAAQCLECIYGYRASINVYNG